MKKFTELKQGDYVWGVHDINWDKNKPSEYKNYPSEYQLQKYVVLKNKLNVPIKRDISDRYESPEYVIDYENYIEIHFHNMVYSRYYTNHYDEYQHMSMHCNYNDNGLWIEIFPDYDTAAKYLKDICQKGIDGCNTRIEEENNKKQLYEKSLKQIEL